MFGQSDGFQSFDDDNEENQDEKLGARGVGFRFDGKQVEQDTHQPHSKMRQLISRAKSIRSTVSSDDADDINRLVELLEDAELNGGHEMMPGLEAELEDILFYLTD